MLLPSYFIIDITRVSELPNIQLPENAFLSYKITPDNIRHLNTFYKKLFLSGNNLPFTLLINMGDGKTLTPEEFEKNIEYLVSATFHYSYIRTNGNNPLFLFESTKANTGAYVDILRKNLTDQGYNDIETISLDKEAICLYPRENSAELFAQYSGELKKIISSGYSFFFFPDTPGHITNILATIAEVELSLEKNGSQIYFLLKENRLLAFKEQQSQIKISLLAEKLDSLKSYHQHTNAPESRYKKQVAELMDFYNTEYEVLPLWYKRLGHILKVVMGKRSFRSLFSDKVKKYRN